jgi:hypothetical protein
MSQRPRGAISESTLGVSSALAYQIVPNVVIGADLWYLRHYDGATFNSFTGDAVYLGPTFYWKIAPKILMSAAWQAQIAGHEAGVSSTLDLTDFSRSRARLLLELSFKTELRAEPTALNVADAAPDPVLDAAVDLGPC